MSRQRISSGHLTRLFLSAAIAAIAIFSLVSTASAQLRPWDASNQVMVDLSVLTDNGLGPTPLGPVALPSLTGDLLDPPSKMPISRLLVKNPPKSGARSYQNLPRVTLKRPSRSAKKRRSARRASKKPRSRAPKVASLKSAPAKPRLKTSKPATKLAPAPKARPKAPVKVAKAPPPPPTVKMPAPAAPKKPEIKAAPKTAAPQTASRPSPAAAQAGNHLIFSQGDAKLSADAKKALDTQAAKLNAAPKSRLQLLAYAGEPNLSPSKARRLSLSRALSVRSYLIKKGVRSTRIDVRALGNKVPSGAPNRVDLKLIGN